MKKLRHILTYSLMLSPLYFAGVAIAEPLQFVSCPIYRDTRVGKKSGCWLVDDPKTGIRYDVSLSPTKPDWNYQVLVEGTVSDNHQDVCGGVVLTPALISILPAKCPAFKLEAEGFEGRAFQRPKRITQPLSSKREAPKGPFSDRVFHLFFEFNKSFITYQFGDYMLDQAIHWLTHAKPKQLVVTGYADTQTRQVSGVTLAEDKAVAQQRAQKVVESLVRMGLPASSISIQLNYDPDIIDADDADGLSTLSRRRVDIAAIF